MLIQNIYVSFVGSVTSTAYYIHLNKGIRCPARQAASRGERDKLQKVRQNYEFPPYNCTGQVALILKGGTRYVSSHKNKKITIKINPFRLLIIKVVCRLSEQSINHSRAVSFSLSLRFTLSCCLSRSFSLPPSLPISLFLFFISISFSLCPSLYHSFSFL